MKTQSPPSTLLTSWIDDFLTDLENANRSPHTCRAYKTDLAGFAHFNGKIETAFLVDSLRAFLSRFSHLKPATRARKQAALSSFCRWAYQHELIDNNPMDLLERVKSEPPQPRGLDRRSIEKILAVIPVNHLRDRLLFRLIFETGLRIGEALALQVDDLDLAPDDEHLYVFGKGGRRRVILLDDPDLVKQLLRYLGKTGYKHGPLFRANKNGRGGALRYQSAQEKWSSYCKVAGIECSLHQLRHSHATELVNAGVSLATIRKRLGHKNLQTTLRYAEQSDATADAEIRNWRRFQRRASS